MWTDEVPGAASLLHNGSDEGHTQYGKGIATIAEMHVKMQTVRVAAAAAQPLLFRFSCMSSW